MLVSAGGSLQGTRGWTPSLLVHYEASMLQVAAAGRARIAPMGMLDRLTWVQDPATLEHWFQE